MRVQVLAFGVLREVLGAGEREMEVPEGSTAADVLQMCRSSAGAQESAIWSTLAVAVNQEYCRRDHVLAAGDVVALLPPVSGGATR